MITGQAIALDQIASVLYGMRRPMEAKRLATQKLYIYVYTYTHVWDSLSLYFSLSLYVYVYVYVYIDICVCHV